MDGFPTRIQTDATYRCANPENGDVENCQTHLLPVRSVVAPVQVQPEIAAHAISEPGSEQRRNQTKQGIEVGDAFSNNPCNDPECQSNTGPRANCKPGTRTHVSGSTENSHVDVLCCNVSVDDTG